MDPTVLPYPLSDLKKELSTKIVQGKMSEISLKRYREINDLVRQSKAKPSAVYCCQEKITESDAMCIVTFKGTKTHVRFDTSYNQMRDIHNLLQTNITDYPSWEEMKYTSIGGIDLRHGWLDEDLRVLRTGDTIVAKNVEGHAEPDNSAQEDYNEIIYDEI